MKGVNWGIEYGAQLAALRRLLRAGFPVVAAFRLSAAGFDVTGCCPVVDGFLVAGVHDAGPFRRSPAHDPAPDEAAAAPATRNTR